MRAFLSLLVSAVVVAATSSHAEEAFTLQARFRERLFFFAAHAGVMQAPRTHATGAFRDTFKEWLATAKRAYKEGEEVREPRGESLFYNSD